MRLYQGENKKEGRIFAHHHHHHHHHRQQQQHCRQHHWSLLRDTPNFTDHSYPASVPIVMTTIISQFSRNTSIFTDHPTQHLHKIISIYRHYDHHQPVIFMRHVSNAISTPFLIMTITNQFDELYASPSLHRPSLLY